MHLKAIKKKDKHKSNYIKYIFDIVIKLLRHIFCIVRLRLWEWKKFKRKDLRLKLEISACLKEIAEDEIFTEKVYYILVGFCVGFLKMIGIMSDSEMI